MEQYGDNHKVELSKKRSKTNGIKMGEMDSGLWVSAASPFLCPQLFHASTDAKRV